MACCVRLHSPLQSCNLKASGCPLLAQKTSNQVMNVLDSLPSKKAAPGARGAVTAGEHRVRGAGGRQGGRRRRRFRSCFGGPQGWQGIPSPPEIKTTEGKPPAKSPPPPRPPPRAQDDTLEGVMPPDAKKWDVFSHETCVLYVKVGLAGAWGLGGWGLGLRGWGLGAWRCWR